MPEKIRFLIVEDDPSAALITQAALEDNWRKRRIHSDVKVCANGQEAIDYLQSAQPLPHVILADVRMPFIDGLRLLKLLKEQERFRSIPVVMLSTSDDSKDIASAFEGQCAGYLIKEPDFQRFSDSLDILQQYWENSKLP